MISKRARFIEKALGSIWLKKTVEQMMQEPKRRNKNRKPPKSFYKKYNTTDFVIDGCECVTIKPSENPLKHIVFFHGGGYTVQATKAHWYLVSKVIRNTGAAVTFINYPLSPQNTCTDTIRMVSHAYTHLFESTKQEIILMGDSAGGGLALALAPQIKAQNMLPKPAKIVLLSPWLDVSMADDIPKQLIDQDKLLDKQVLSNIGKKYAGELGVDHFLCSPVHGDVKDIGQIALFISTGEILFPQAKALTDKMRQLDVDFYYREYENMQHDWMLFPIPEATQALREVYEFIEQDGSK
jgi:acetyl esterase/lipase